MRRIYLDHMAAAPLDPRVFQAMVPFLQDHFGNPQSLHSFGQDAQTAVEDARQSVARLIGASSEEIVFTAGGSESNNFALKGLATANRERGTHIVVSAVEHQSVLRAVKSLEKQGFRSTEVPVDASGRVDPDGVGRALAKDTCLVSVMTANSEVGTIEPITEIVKICRGRNVLFHTDAVAAAGHIPLDVKTLGVDALSLAGDPMSGPKGSAALFVRQGVKISPLIDGGIQEGGRRAGTENVAAIVGLGRAAELSLAEMDQRAARARELRDYLIDGLLSRIEHVVLTGHRTERLPHQASFCVRFIEGEGMLLSLDMKGVAVSSGSACTSKSLKASHVLLAMGLDHALAQGSIVFGLPASAARDDIDTVLEVFPPIVRRLRDMSPLYTQFLQEKK